MEKIYACLVGDWVCLNDDPESIVGNKEQSPSLWWEESAEVYSPTEKPEPNTLYHFDYVNIKYHGKNFRINPMFIQVVTD